VADLLAGIMWYAAGLLVASRTARWIGSRLIPIGFALVVNILAIALSMHILAFLLIVGAGFAVMLLGARGAFASGGDLPRRAVANRIVAGLSLAAGWIVAVMLAVALTGALLSALFPPPPLSTAVQIAILDDGRIVHEGFGHLPTTDLDGKPIAGLSALQIDQHRLNFAMLRLEDQRPEGQGALPERVSDWGFHGSSGHLRPFSYVSTNGTSWFYIVSQNTIDGYDTIARRRAGSLSPGGWSPGSQPFPERLDRVGSYDAMRTGVIVASDRTVWRVDFDRREVHRTFVADPGDLILDASWFYDAPKDAESQDRSAGNNVVVTRQAIFIFKDGQAPVRIPQPVNVDAYYSINIARTLDGRLVLDFIPQPEHHPLALRTIILTNGQGKILQLVELPASPPESTSYWEDALPALSLPPFLLIILMQIEPLNGGPQVIAITWTVMSIVSALALAVTLPLAWRRQFSTAGVAGWAALNLLLGIPGVLLLISMDDAVPTVRCESCGHERPISRQQCPHCNAGFAPPAKTGIEIFVAA
jgi:hypothetical protein